MTSKTARSYLWVDDLSTEGILQLFSRARQIKENLQNHSLQPTLTGKQIALVFSEASTRTKMSFQMAAQRLGASCLVIDNVRSSSMSKGESFTDTFWTLHAIRPDLFVIRCGDGDPLDEVAAKSEIPVLNAGFGSREHPTQALLDAFTLLEHFGTLEGVKILFVGDIDHSRVAKSNFRLLQDLGAVIKVSGPEHFCQDLPAGVENIEDLNKAIPWCDAYVGLRVQFERHGGQTLGEITRQEFRDNYSLGSEGLKLMAKKAVIMHPGPVNWGVEFQEEVRKDPRLLMWKQKENGVYTRAALMELFLKGKQ